MALSVDVIDASGNLIDPKMIQHRYVEKLLKLHREGKIRPASVTEVNIFHDDWCRIYQGCFCNCDCEVQLKNSKEK
jgi:hypothetical protein